MSRGAINRYIYIPLLMASAPLGVARVRERFRHALHFIL